MCRSFWNEFVRVNYAFSTLKFYPILKRIEFFLKFVLGPVNSENYSLEFYWTRKQTSQTFRPSAKSLTVIIDFD